MAQRLRAAPSPQRPNLHPDLFWPSGRISFDEFLLQWPCEVDLPVDLDYQLAGAGGAAEAADFALLFGPLTRILPDLPPEQHEAVRSALERFFQDYVTPQGVALPAAFWVVQARV